MKITLHILRAYSTTKHNGVTVAVVPDANEFTSWQKMVIAESSPCDQTVFASVSAPGIKPELFHAGYQIPLTDTAIIAALWCCRKIGKISCDSIAVETVNGSKAAVFSRNIPYIQYDAPGEFFFPGKAEEMLTTLNLTAKELAYGSAPVVMTNGDPMLLVPVKDQNVLRSISMNKPIAQQVCNDDRLDAICAFAISLSHDTDAICRIFEARQGMQEQVVSGTTAVQLACFLSWNKYIKRKHIVIEQGSYASPPSRSLLHVILDLNGVEIRSALCGGNCFYDQKIELVINALTRKYSGDAPVMIR